ncbi:hypothetical protein HPP92_013509 [Vanilla planifolia]|uniref:Uncharacterized protein n=1 Tax=Vanilla planifolia TaxID=51239 RepID=A0A835QSE3_VANPL|nr:hypothetical protein HPP92_013509 [Vanilla planifolia]
MANLDSYANNSGLCGIQIQVECEPAEAPLALDDDEEEDQTWFSWEAILVGSSLSEEKVEATIEQDSILKDLSRLQVNFTARKA